MLPVALRLPSLDLDLVLLGDASEGGESAVDGKCRPHKNTPRRAQAEPKAPSASATLTTGRAIRERWPVGG